MPPLTTDANDDTLCLLQFVDIHHTLIAKLLKVQPVGFIEVGGDGLRVVVDHDRALAHLTELARARDRAPIELDTAANTIDTASQNHSTVIVEFNIVFRRVVSRVEVVGVGRVFGSKSVNTLNEGGDTEGFTVSTDSIFLGRDKVGDVGVRETHAFGMLHQLVVNVLDRTSSFKSVDGLNNVINLVQEPLQTKDNY